MTNEDRAYGADGTVKRKVPLVADPYKPVFVKVNSIVGYCHNYNHTAYLTKGIMKEHQCLEKGCFFFEKFHDYPYWKSQRRIQRARERQKAERENEQKRQAVLVARRKKKEDAVMSAAKAFAEAHNYPIIITRVAYMKGDRCWRYIINYVSDCPHSDWRNYRPMISALRERFGCGYSLRRVKMPNGKWATIHDWENRPASRNK